MRRAIELPFAQTASEKGKKCGAGKGITEKKINKGGGKKGMGRQVSKRGVETAETRKKGKKKKTSWFPVGGNNQKVKNP